MHVGGNGRLRFGNFEYDSQSGKLFREGRPVKIQPQPLRVLGVLLERAGEIVFREQLHTRVWGDATFVEFDQSLNYCIRQIRLALRDGASEPLFIETLPKQGYRFIARVTVAPGVTEVNGTNQADPAPADPPQPAPPDPVFLSLAETRKPVARKNWHTTAAWMGLLAVAALSGLAVFRSARKSSTPRPEKSIAVLPFLDLSPTKDQEYFCDAMTDELISELARIDGLRVVARTSVFAFKGKPQDVRQVGN
jgi:DNA-binding winged helix-turn-helix (wHTH) protein